MLSVSPKSTTAVGSMVTTLVQESSTEQRRQNVCRDAMSVCLHSLFANRATMMMAMMAMMADDNTTPLHPSRLPRALQTLCCDKATVLPVVDAGALGESVVVVVVGVGGGRGGGGTTSRWCSWKFCGWFMLRWMFVYRKLLFVSEKVALPRRV